MIDPMTAHLAQIYNHERLMAAELARQRRATAGQTTTLIDRLRLVLGRRLIALGRQMQPHTARQASI